MGRGEESGLPKILEDAVNRAVGGGAPDGGPSLNSESTVSRGVHSPSVPPPPPSRGKLSRPNLPPPSPPSPSLPSREVSGAEAEGQKGDVRSVPQPSISKPRFSFDDMDSGGGSDGGGSVGLVESLDGSVVEDGVSEGGGEVFDVNRPVADSGSTGPSVVVEASSSSKHGGKDLDIISLLEYVVSSGASDLHLSHNAPPIARIDGDLEPIPGWGRLNGEEIKDAVYKILETDQKDRFEEDKELDFAYTISNGARFRGNLLKQMGHVGGVFRVIPQKILPLSALNLPPVIGNFAYLPRGLVLVTGPTGSGKSTTLAAIIDQINRTRQEHILTIEDPVEFVHKHRSCVVNQREVGRDTEEYNVALKHALRQDPDVILIGEMRDLETISIALTAAETGHLVFATLHTQSAKDTISRIIDVFPSGQQQQVRSQLAATLRGVVCQTLLKRADGKGRIAATEIMIVNHAIANNIRQDKLHTIPSSLQTGEAEGNQTLNMHLADLVLQNAITRDEAFKKSEDGSELETLLSGARSKKQTFRNLNQDDEEILKHLKLDGV